MPASPSAIEGLGLAERAYQQALAYARERIQGRATGGRRRSSSYPDVRRMLLTMRAQIAAMRALAYWTAGFVDRSGAQPIPASATLRRRPGRAADARSSRPGRPTSRQEIASQAVQVHGGMGFIEETGAAQHYRDASILSIYEGTNGIQAMDLVGRKLDMAGGELPWRLIAELRAELPRLPAKLAPDLSRALDVLERTTRHLQASAPDDRAAGAAAYLRLLATSWARCCSPVVLRPQARKRVGTGPASPACSRAPSCPRRWRWSRGSWPAATPWTRRSWSASEPRSQAAPIGSHRRAFDQRGPGDPGRDDPGEVQPGCGKQLPKLRFGPLTPARADQHVDVVGGGTATRVRLIDARRIDALDDHEPRGRPHRPPAGPEKCGRPIVVPVVDDVLEDVGVGTGRHLHEEIAADDRAAVRPPAACSTGRARSTTGGRSNSVPASCGWASRMPTSSAPVPAHVDDAATVREVNRSRRPPPRSGRCDPPWRRRSWPHRPGARPCRRTAPGRTPG